jgi:hypothetical protein
MQCIPKVCLFLSRLLNLPLFSLDIIFYFLLVVIHPWGVLSLSPLPNFFLSHVETFTISLAIVLFLSLQQLTHKYVHVYTHTNVYIYVYMCDIVAFIHIFIKFVCTYFLYKNLIIIKRFDTPM